MSYRLSILLFFLYYSVLLIPAQNAFEIIENADSRMRGESSYSEMNITTIRPKWQKTMSLKNWTIGSDYAVHIL
jgi:hypothetical protein